MAVCVSWPPPCSNTRTPLAHAEVHVLGFLAFLPRRPTHRNLFPGKGGHLSAMFKAIHIAIVGVPKSPPGKTSNRRTSPGECLTSPLLTLGVAQRAPWRSTKCGVAGVSGLLEMPTDSYHFPCTSDTLVRPQHTLARKALSATRGLAWGGVRHSPAHFLWPYVPMHAKLVFSNRAF